jgi:threonine synthase
VGDPSNFPRLYYLFENNLEQLRRMFSADIITNKEILETIQSVFQQHNYLLDPHSATGYLGLTREIKNDEVGFFVSTAHPVKFVEIIEKVLPGEAERLKKEFGADTALQGGTEHMPVSYKSLKDKLIEL